MRNRPADAVDGCWTAATETTPAEFIAEPQTFSRESTSLAGFHAIRVNDQYRIIFRFEGEHAFDVRCTDYH